jgi:serine/threonine-protein kinase
VVFASILVTLFLLSIAASRAAASATGAGLDRTSRLAIGTLSARARSLQSAAQVFALNPVFRSLVLDERPGDLLDQAIEAADRIGASWVQIVSASGVRLAKSDDPTAPRSVLAGSALISEALGGASVSAFGSTADSALFQAVAVPISVDTGRVAGVLMAAWMIDSSLAGEVKRASASEVVFYTVDTLGQARIAASTLPNDANAPLVERLRSIRLEDDSASRVNMSLGSDAYVGHTIPLRSAGGEVLGGVLALRSRTAELAPFSRLRTWIVLSGLGALTLAFVLAWFTARSIAQPVQSLERTTRRVAEGDYMVDVDVRSNDEIGALASAVRTMVADLREKQNLVDILRNSTEGRTALERAKQPGGAGDRIYTQFAPGQVVAGRYAIRETLGAGGSGVVYRALDQKLDEAIAIKVIPIDKNSGDAVAIERLKSEIRLARRISHRNVVRTHDIGEANGAYFITMELVHGTSLRELIDTQHALPIPATFAIGKQLCRGLEVAHGEGIVHRDIKPQNLMLSPDGTLKIMDFGVARLAARPSQLTEVGYVVGTPEYMAPEQLLDEAIDARTDLYAVGIVLYECLTGARPFVAETAAALIGLKLAGQIKPPHEVSREIPRALSEAVVRALGNDPNERPASAIEFHDMLVAAEA